MSSRRITVSNLLMKDAKVGLRVPKIGEMLILLEPNLAVKGLIVVGSLLFVYFIVFSFFFI